MARLRSAAASCSTATVVFFSPEASRGSGRVSGDAIQADSVSFCCFFLSCFFNPKDTDAQRAQKEKGGKSSSNAWKQERAGDVRLDIRSLSCYVHSFSHLDFPEKLPIAGGFFFVFFASRYSSHSLYLTSPSSIQRLLCNCFPTLRRRSCLSQNKGIKSFTSSAELVATGNTSSSQVMLAPL